VRIDCDAHGWMEGWIYVVDQSLLRHPPAPLASSASPTCRPGTTTLVAIQSFTGPIQATRNWLRQARPHEF